MSDSARSDGSAGGDALGVIEAEIDVALGRPERVEASCSALRSALRGAPPARLGEVAGRLAGLLARRGGPIAEPIHALALDLLPGADDPGAAIRGLLRAREARLVDLALDRIAALVAAGRLAADRAALSALADACDLDGSAAARPDAVARIAPLLPERAAEQAWLGDPDPAVRRLGARVLDLADEPAPRERAVRLLGEAAWKALGPLLQYTRASHLDLACIVPAPGVEPPVAEAVRRAEPVCGHALLADAVARLGWARVNLGLEVRPYVLLSVGGAIPFLVSPAQAALFERCGPSSVVRSGFLVLAHGGRVGGAPGGGEPDGAVTRFRRYNVRHAELLGDLLDLAPLDADRARRMAARLGEVVADYAELFAGHDPDCDALTSCWAGLRERVEREVAAAAPGAPLPPEATRLVLSFEDPARPSDVRTLHGLKRLLHQRGLRLGFRLVRAGGATDRTVDLVLCSPDAVERVVPVAAYVDFEGGAGASQPLDPPHAVRIVAEGFARQLAYGHASFPGVRIFRYGNEVHYFLAYGNHPALVRIDFSAPLRGGMIDLEYFGVSRYDHGNHPDPTLAGIRRMFRELEFDVGVESTRIHARYDKERAFDLGDVCDKAEALFRLAPHLMDVDWVLGGLRLSAEARARVAESWAEGFAHHGALPADALLTADRTGVLMDLEPGPLGLREVAWDGIAPYRDRFSRRLPAGFRERVVREVAALGLDVAPPADDEQPRGSGQLDLERHVLRALDEAVARGQITASPEGFVAAPAERYLAEHEVERFAELLGSDDAALAAAARLARLVSGLERTLRFRVTGAVQGGTVEAASLRLPGTRAAVWVLRDPGGMPGLALYSSEGTLCRRRDAAELPWEVVGGPDAAGLAAALRGAGFPPPDPTPDARDLRLETRASIERLRTADPPRDAPPAAGERIARGLPASPGRAVGRAAFGTAGRLPSEMAGAILVAAAVRPEDGPFLYRAAGVVSTGGGVLSHAGLLAIQYRKPALVVAGRWVGGPGSRTALLYRALDYRVEERVRNGLRLSIRRDVREREHRMEEGDLVVVDSGDATLRVLGQDVDTLALHDALAAWKDAGERLSRARDDTVVLALRGHRLRARHQIAKVLSRLDRPALARHAVRELLDVGALAGDPSAVDERAELLRRLLRSARVGDAARDALLVRARELRTRHRAALDRAVAGVPLAESPYELLALRLDALRVEAALGGAAAALHACGLDVAPVEAGDRLLLDPACRRRLVALREEVRDRADRAATGDAELRHALRLLERMAIVLDEDDDDRRRRERRIEAIAREDRARAAQQTERRVLASSETDHASFPIVGRKAANLGEIERLGGAGLVPPWIAVTDRAFREALATPVAFEDEDGRTAAVPLGRAIDAVLARSGLDARRRSVRIRDLWERLRLPRALEREVAAAYAGLPFPAGAEEPGYVAVRSSAREEDAEAETRAGEFDTFLFVRGEVAVVDHVKRAWAGLWTERALRDREVSGGGGGPPGGGVIVQRMVEARVSGVLQTVNVAEGDHREIVINAGLGLGEGVVSGTVAADQIVVRKDAGVERGTPRFRYVVADKRERVVFDRAAGAGTARVETLYHQRLRAALEHVELVGLARIARRLERAYGHPLDVEFAIEGDRLWILQVRPLATHLALLRETAERFPLSVPGRPFPGPALTEVPS